MFNTLIVQPVFNLLVLIYALLPGHNFGLAIILFTIVIRLLLWPLLRKQLHQTKAMRKLQPELKRIKKDAKGDRQKESAMVMALYKEHGVNPVGSLGIVLLQLPILIALYQGLQEVTKDPYRIVSFAYSGLQQLPWMQELASDIHRFDGTLFGAVDLSKSALQGGVIYWPAMVIVVGSALIQYFQSKQLLVTGKNARSLRAILRDAGKGQEADQAEVSAAVVGVTSYFIPIMIFAVTVSLPSALGLYWLVGGLVAYWQQARILREDETELEALADSKQVAKSSKKPSKDTAAIPEAEVVATQNDPVTTKQASGNVTNQKPATATNTKKAQHHNKKRKRR